MDHWFLQTQLLRLRGPMECSEEGGITLNAFFTDFPVIWRNVSLNFIEISMFYIYIYIITAVMMEERVG